MNLIEKIKRLLVEHKDEIAQFEKELSDSVAKRIEEGKSLPEEKQFKTLDVCLFEKEVVKSGAGEYLVIKGIASNGKVDRGSDSVLPQGIKAPNAIDGRIPMLHAHDHEQIVGHWYTFGVKEDQYLVEGRLYKKYDPKVYEQVLNGDLRALSIGFMPIDWERSAENPDVLVFKEVELLEVSLVAVGMHQEARLISVSKPTEKSNEELVEKSLEASEGEAPAELPENPTAQEVEQPEASQESEEVAEEIPDSEVTTEDKGEDDKVQKLETELEQLRQENAQLKTELDEIGELLSETEEVIEQLKDDKELKYGLKK